MSVRTGILWIRRGLIIVFLAWGTSAAVVAFGIRFELGPFASQDVSESRVPYSDPEVPFTRVKLDHWDGVRTPAQVAKAFESALRDQTNNWDTSRVLDVAHVSLALVVHPDDSAAVWRATYRLGCNCPYSQSEPSTALVAFFDPYEGVLLGPIEAVDGSFDITGDTPAGLLERGTDHDLAEQR